MSTRAPRVALTRSTFLPQDKVSDFAKMNPEFVLKETMLAAGDSRMTEWHEKLITRGGEAKDVDSVGWLCRILS